MLCLGIYRFRDVEEADLRKAAPSNKRYVICNPDADFCLTQTDSIYVLQQFDPNKKTMLRNVPKIPEKIKLAKRQDTSRTNSGSFNYTEQPRYFDCRSTDCFTNSRHSLKPTITLNSLKNACELVGQSFQ
jgi:hypothetical protein